MEKLDKIKVLKLLSTIILRKLIIFQVLRPPYWIHYWDRKIYWKMAGNIQSIKTLHFEGINFVQCRFMSELFRKNT